MVIFSFIIVCIEFLIGLYFYHRFCDACIETVVMEEIIRFKNQKIEELEKREEERINEEAHKKLFEIVKEDF